jgi:Ala-tRNA(Pro) deacylase
MTCRDRLVSYFKENGVPFTTMPHRTAYTAQEVAAAEHVPGKLVAKVVMAVTTRGLVMLVLPATHRINLSAVREALSDPEVRLAHESEFAALFPDCETGAMPPFGNLYNLPVVVERALTEDPEIVFQDGSHQETMRISYRDYERLVQPEIKEFAYHM